MFASFDIAEHPPVAFAASKDVIVLRWGNFTIALTNEDADTICRNIEAARGSQEDMP